MSRIYWEDTGMTVSLLWPRNLNRDSIEIPSYDYASSMEIVK